MRVGRNRNPAKNILAAIFMSIDVSPASLEAATLWLREKG